MQNNERVIDRLDPEVNFDFGTAGPSAEPDKFEPDQFSIRWEGSVLAPETGNYEFIVRTEHAAKLWINDNKQPLIDNWVKSGNDIEFRASLFLLGGRAYPLRFEFSGQAGRRRLEDQQEQAEGRQGVHRAPVEASAPGRRGDSRAKPVAGQVSRAVRP